MKLEVTKIDPIRRDIVLAVDGWLSKDQQQKLFVKASRKILSDVELSNRAALAFSSVVALSQEISHETVVDGVKTEDIERAEMRIVRTYDLVELALSAIGSLLWKHSPHRRGRYRASHRLLADGSEIAVVTSGSWQAPKVRDTVRELIFVPTVIYARPIEKGRSKQAPDGVYQVVAQLARGSFTKFAQVSFAYRQIQVSGNASSNPDAVKRFYDRKATVQGTKSQPVIIIRPR